MKTNVSIETRKLNSIFFDDSYTIILFDIYYIT